MVAHVLLNISCSLFWSIWSVNAGQSTGLGGEEADAVSSPVIVSSTREHTHTKKKEEIRSPTSKFQEKETTAYAGGQRLAHAGRGACSLSGGRFAVGGGSPADPWTNPSVEPTSLPSSPGPPAKHLSTHGSLCHLLTSCLAPSRLRPAALSRIYYSECRWGGRRVILHQHPRRNYFRALPFFQMTAKHCTTLPPSNP